MTRHTLLTSPYQGGVWFPTRMFSSEDLQTRRRLIDVIIPALNEQESLPRVLEKIPATLVRRVVVVDNGSTDGTAEVARQSGAQVVSEPRRGYGQACLAGIDALRSDPPDVVVFLDADYSDHPEELDRVVAPILLEQMDMVIGSRMIGMREPGALLPQALFGNRLATMLIDLIYHYRFTDLGPFRAITWEALERIGMRDTNYGWTVEMQIKAAFHALRAVEVPVSYRKRIGVSKVSGTLEGSVKAGYKILWTIFRYAAELSQLSPTPAQEDRG